MKIGSSKGDFLPFPRHSLSFIQFNEFLTLEMLLESVVYLQTKGLKTNAEVLRQLQHLTSNVVDHSILTNFEHGMIAALNQEYPFVPQKICLFHLSERIYQYVQELGLSMAAS